MTKKHKILIFILFALGLSFGLKLSLRSWKGAVTARFDKTDRDVAADVRQAQVLKNLDPKLRDVSNIIGSLKIGLDRSDRVSLFFGNYFYPETGQYLCSLFNRVEIHLRSVGYAVSGSPVRLTYEGPCPGHSLKQIENLDPFPLLDSNLCRLTGLLEVEEVYPDIYLNIENIDSEFPYNWAIDMVSFYDSSNRENALLFDESKIRKINQGRLIPVSCD